MNTILIITGALFCSVSLLIFSRRLFSSVKYNDGTVYIYTSQEREGKKLKAKKKAILDKKLDISALIINIIGIICQVVAAFL